MRHIVRLEGQDHAAALSGPVNDRQLLLDGAALAASLVRKAGSSAALQVAGTTFGLHIAGTDDRLFIRLDGEVYEVAVLEPLAVHARQAGAATGLEARAPMPGSVVALPVAVGDSVRAGDTLVIIESMKLEVALKATQPGRVAAISCAVGRSFEKDAVLVVLAGEGSA